MATTTPLSYNPSLSPIAGTTQVGTLAVGTTQQDYSINPGGVTWWMGPDEDLGYVIGIPVSGGTQPTPIIGVFASLGFYRSADLTDNSFVDLTNSVFNQSFSSATESSIWLTNNGYWNSYIIVPLSPTPTSTETPTPTVTPTNTETPTPEPTQTPTNTSTPTQTQTPTNTITPTNTASQTQTPTPSITASQTVTPTNTITPTNTRTPSVTPTNTITPTNTQTPTNTITPSITASQTNTPTKTATPTTTQTPTNTNTPSVTPTKTSTPTPTNINAQGFSYANFASTTGLVGVGNTSVSSNIYYLTTAAAGQVGNVYRTTAIQYNKNFSATWSTFIGGGTGADGYCVQWTPTNNTNGPTGGGVGYVSTAINAITFLTYTNNNYTWYKSNVSQGTTSVTSGLWRQTLYFWGDYNNSAQTFALYWNTTNSKPGSPNKTFSSFSFDTGSYYMGFGAGTGGANDNQELLSWSLQFT